MRWIDIAKGLCMIAVVLGHLGVPEWGFVYSFHLTVFFLLSGYTLREGAITKEWLKDRFQRLMTPYFITCFAVAIMDAINNLILSQDQTIKTFTSGLYNSILRVYFASGSNAKMGGLWMGTQIGAIWFLPAMFFALLAARFLQNKVRGAKWQMLWGIGVAAVGCASARLLWLPFSIQSAMLAVPFILAGSLLRKKQILEKIKWPHLLAFAAIFAGGCLMGWEKIFFVNCRADHWLFTPLLAMISGLLIIGICRLIKKFPPLEWIGRNSLTFLCIHLFELNTLHPHLKNFCLASGIPFTKTVVFFGEMLFILLVLGLLGLIKKWMGRCKAPAPKGERSLSIDIMRAILIILMIVGHLSINAGLRRVIYSIHMMAFIMISGYFYRDGLPLSAQWKKCFKMLLPYGIFAVAALLLKQKSFIDLALGLSFSKQLFSSHHSVGPVYFILLLFLVRWIYSLLPHKNEWIRTGLVLFLGAAGIWLGREGYWLPWSLDCALFALLFYHLGYGLKKHRFLERCKEWPILYFLFASFWAYFLREGSMELATRNYGDAGITLVGVFGAFMVLYQLCCYLEDHWPRWLSALFGLIGQSTGYILVFHTLFGGKISKYLVNSLGLWKENVAFLLVYVASQIIIGVLIYLGIELLKKVLKKWFAH